MRPKETQATAAILRFDLHGVSLLNLMKQSAGNMYASAVEDTPGGTIVRTEGSRTAIK